MERVAVVTGANKGIGLAIVKGLCQQFDGVVYLTARDANRGLEAVKSLEKAGLKPKFHQLDITDDESIVTFKNYLEKTHGGLDVLVNNAAIAFKVAATEPFEYQAKETLRVNYFSLQKLCNKIYPLLRDHARVVHVSSSSGRLLNIPDESLRQKLAAKLTEEELDEYMNEFVKLAKTKSHTKHGWPNSAYVVSKVGVCALTEIHQSKFDLDSQRDIVVNSVHPGYVDTDMTSHKGNLTPDQGAETPIHCAMLPENTDIKGKYFWYDKTIRNWK